MACLRAIGRPIYAINPTAAARYRDRQAVSRRKSDPLDAMVLANILRTDTAMHRALPADSELAQVHRRPGPRPAGRRLDRTQAGSKLRSHLRECYPGYLAAVAPVAYGLATPVARTLLAAAPTPEQGARRTRAQLRAVVRKVGRQRGIDKEADRLPQIRKLPLVEQAMGVKALALLRQLEATCTSADELSTAVVESF